MSKHEIIQLIGEGGFGKIYKIKYHDGSEKALKQIEWRKLNLVETDVLLNIDSPFLVKAWDINNEGFVLDLLDGDVWDLLGKLTPREILNCFLQVMDGLYCLHKQGLIHMDIKPENFLRKLDKKNNKYLFVLSDYGLSIRTVDAFKTFYTNVSGYTEDYLPPEFMKNRKGNKHPINSQTDIWMIVLTFIQIFKEDAFTIKKRLNYKSSFEYKKKYFSKMISHYSSRYKFNRNEILNQYQISKFSELLADMYSDYHNRPNSRDIITNKFFNEEYENMLHNMKIKGYCREKQMINYFVPFVNHFTIDAIQELYNKSYKYEFRLFFLSCEIFLQIESLDHTLYSYQEELERVKLSFVIAKSFLFGDHLDGLSKSEILFASQFLSERIRGEKFYSRAKYLEDMEFLLSYLLTSTTILHCYNLINPDNLFDIFRSLYYYESKTKLKDINDEKFPLSKLNIYDTLKLIETNTILKDGYHFNENKKVSHFRDTDFSEIIDDMTNLSLIIKKEIESLHPIILLNEANTLELSNIVFKSDHVLNEKIFEYIINLLDLNNKFNKLENENSKLKKGLNLINNRELIIVEGNSLLYFSGFCEKNKDDIFWYDDNYKKVDEEFFFEDNFQIRILILIYLYQFYEQFYDAMIEPNIHLIYLFIVLSHEITAFK